MGTYDKEYLTVARRELGPLLQVEDAFMRKYTNTGENLPCTAEFRAKGILFYNKKENFSLRVNADLIEKVSREIDNIDQEKDGKEMIVLNTSEESGCDEISFQIQYPDVIESGIKKLIKDNEQRSKNDKNDQKNIVKKLESLAKLQASGLITEEEYAQRKKILLDQMTGSS